MALHFNWKQGQPPVGTIDASVLIPRSAPIAELAALSISIGNRQYRWSDVFDIAGEAGNEWTVPDCPNYLNLGQGMSTGLLRVEGHAGDFAGCRMTGGKLEVHGSAGYRLGASLAGGFITVSGNVEAEVGGPATEFFEGMTDGEILIAGSAGPRAGFRMRRGLIAMHRAGEQAGHHLQAGTLLVTQGPLVHPGLGMKRGTIICLDADAKPGWLPYYQPDCIYRPVILQMILGRLASLGFHLPPEARQARYQLYTGDRLTQGKGELFQRLAQ